MKSVFGEVSIQLGMALARHMAPDIVPLPLVKWGQMLLPAYFRLPPSRMHHWLGRELDLFDTQRGARLNVLGRAAAPRAPSARLPTC
jgi:hypothetical protein